MCVFEAHQIHSDRNLVAQQVSSFSFTVYIPCKLDSSLFYVESWPGVLVASPVVSQTQQRPSAESLCCVCGARLSYFLLLGPCAVRSEPDLAVSSGWVPVLFVKSQTQLLSSAES